MVHYLYYDRKLLLSGSLYCVSLYNTIEHSNTNSNSIRVGNIDTVLAI